MKRLPLKTIDSNSGLAVTSRKSKYEMRFVDMINGALVMGLFGAFSIFSWYMLLKLLHIF